MERKKILLIDDDHHIAAIVSDILEDMGFELHHKTGLPNWEHVATLGKYELVMVDATIDKGRGMGFARKMRTVGERSPVVLFTGLSTSEIGDCPCDVRILHKPFKIEDISSLLKDLKLI